MVQPDFRAHIPYMSGNHIKNGEIGGNGLGEIKIPGSSCLKRVYLRQQHNRSQSPGQKGIYSKADTGHRQSPQSLRRVYDYLGNDIDDHENTYHDGYIIIGKDGKSQGNTV